MSSVYSNPVTVLIARMAYHAAPNQTGRLLSRWKWYDGPTEHPDGQKDFPSVQLWVPDIQESYRRASAGESTMTLKLTVATLRSAGVAGLLDAVALVMDAIETREDGQLNPGLSGTLMKPFDMAAGNCSASGLSLTAEVTVTITPKIFNRGRRTRAD